MQITTDQYKKALSSPDLVKDGDVKLLNFLFFAPQEALSAPMLSQLLGRAASPGPANSTIGNLGKKIATNLGLELPKREVDNPGWWRVIAHGEDRPEGFFWKMRDELADALIDLDLLDEAMDIPSELLAPQSDTEKKTTSGAVNIAWTADELEVALSAYIEMRQKEIDGVSFTKNAYYKKLAHEQGRTEKSYEYRMQNISYVYSLMGRRWVSGLKPARNVGSRVAGEIETLINKIEGQASFKLAAFQSNVNEIRRKKNLSSPPIGNKNPSKTSTVVTQYNRSQEVVAWVLDKANGLCEKCGKAAPFIKEDGFPYLEVHHMRMLADCGSDTVTNAIAVCPNCHMELHYGNDKISLSKSIYTQVARLVSE